MNANEIDDKPIPKFAFENNNFDPKNIKKDSLHGSKKMSKQNSKESLKKLNDSKVVKRSSHQCSCHSEKLEEKIPSSKQSLKDEKIEQGTANKLSKFFKDEKGISLKQEIVTKTFFFVFIE